MRTLFIAAAATLLGCATAPALKVSSARTVTSIPLPGATGALSLDYIAYDARHHRVWVPAADTGSVDVIDSTNAQLSRVEGFGVAQVERHGKMRTVGPSAVTIGKDLAFIGNRGDSTICPVDLESLARGECLKLETRPDAVVWVEPTSEVWVTSPSAKKIYVLDAATHGKLSLKQTLDMEGEPEGYAVDAARGVFFTNYEDKDRTLMIDLATKKILQSWPTGCGEDGGKGIALDAETNHLAVACADGVVVLDPAKNGVEVSRLKTGEGNDNIDFLPARHELFVGGAKAATLTIAALDAAGKLTVSEVVPTLAGARNAVATETGAVYLADGPEAKVIVVSSAK
jgi:DNA-binding beta-propeller fold protein YncE